jgi:nucleotide-binding universal stress UspA family protein
MRTIIVPTDFSDPSLNATQYGIDLANRLHASLTLVHVYQVPATISDTPVVLVSIDELKNSAHQQLQLQKSEVEEKNPGLKVYAEAVLGNVLDEVESVCEKLQPLAVVMGSKGTTSLEEVIFGSTTLAIIRHLRWPVICVPARKVFGTGIHKIGFACDFRKVVQSTPAHEIIAFVKEFNAELHVLNIDHKQKHFKADTPEESLLLETLLEEIKPVYHFIDNAKVEEGINDFADNNGIDLLIAIPKKHGILEAFFKGSYTRQLVFHSHVPVMCIHEE